MDEGQPPFRRAAGCGCGSILAVVLIVALVGWMLSTSSKPTVPRSLEPIPEDVPPAAGAEVPMIDVHGQGRTSDKLSYWAEPLAGQTGIPEPALRAYGNAELIAADAWPQCRLEWNTLAGIGWVETRHGTYSGKLFGGSEIDENGYAQPPIVGIPLDGTSGTAKIPDTDGGEWDGDAEHDRAIGPMQFIPESWRRYGLDANGDGEANPHQIDDAALAAANHLCRPGHDLSTPEGWTAAILGYNQSRQYLIDVRDAAASYALRQPAP
ncbi:lytic transglycosylase domain-containing protein [Corynebacterium guangdongense]|uniref:Membrane-bound lytic murein transglycosylase B n=1 Tax=Corynebacterium guangdongense TaxID=1783348 RepID=A0ABU1ZVF2_9CORY|nr:lytic murein transglycosylase [Corynebacterium guangdongense]MDR7328909.1 membrane-bound lytic murein transglycosylase B [Corynebacterium guangdongense]WJZ17484.1 hypothetical protein CGUA_04475 [Corynebacterium guangdongense]